MHKIFSASAIAVCVLLTGCHSHWVAATITNHSGANISVLELDYPSASFGTTTLRDGAHFDYRFKIQGSAPLKLTYTDAKGHDHQYTGPVLNEGQEGSLAVTIEAASVTWQPNLTAN